MDEVHSYHSEFILESGTYPWVTFDEEERVRGNVIPTHFTFDAVDDSMHTGGGRNHDCHQVFHDCHDLEQTIETDFTIVQDAKVDESLLPVMRVRMANTDDDSVACLISLPRLKPTVTDDGSYCDKPYDIVSPPHIGDPIDMACDNNPTKMYAFQSFVQMPQLDVANTLPLSDGYMAQQMRSDDLTEGIILRPSLPLKRGEMKISMYKPPEHSPITIPKNMRSQNRKCMKRKRDQRTTNTMEVEKVTKVAKTGATVEWGCRCNKTNCLKLYCDCFQRGVICKSSCDCVGCLNTEKESTPDGARTKRIKTILKRRPDAFQKRTIKPDASCACKFSRCLKKYCQCYMQRRYCLKECSCSDCHNREDASQQDDQVDLCQEFEPMPTLYSYDEIRINY